MSSLNLDIVEVGSGTPAAEGNPKWLEAECQQYAGNVDYTFDTHSTPGTDPAGCFIRHDQDKVWWFSGTLSQGGDCSPTKNASRNM